MKTLNSNSKRKIFIFAVIIFVLLLAGFSEAKNNQVDAKSRNIFELFTKSNPCLNAATAKNYVEIIMSACDKYKQDPYVIAGIIVHESTINNKAVGGGNYGLMQINWKAHASTLKREYPNKIKKAKDLFDAKVNIMYGTKVFAYYMSRAKNNLKGGLLGYSAGSKKLTNKVLATVKELQSKDSKDKRNNKDKRKGK